MTEVAFSLPLLVTTMVYTSARPAVTGSVLSSFVIVSTGREETIVSAVAESGAVCAESIQPALANRMPFVRGLSTATVNTIRPDTGVDNTPMDQKGSSGNPPEGAGELATYDTLGSSTSVMTVRVAAWLPVLE